VKPTGFQLVKKFPAFYEPEVRYCIHKCLQPVPILRCINPVHTPTSYFLKIHLNIFHPSTSGYPKWSLYLRFPYQNPVYACAPPICATCHAHLILLDLITQTILGEEYSSSSQNYSTKKKQGTGKANNVAETEY